MGPRSFNRGRGLVANSGGADSGWLQWGLGLSTEEGRMDDVAPNGRSVGFNGASVFQPRKALQMGTIRLIPQIASMGPRSFNRGRQSTFPATCLASAASMGPRSFNRGRRFPHSPSARPETRFNGASVFQPRKAPAPAPSPAPSKQGFNGASVFQPRKVDTLITRKTHNERLQWGLGLSTEEGQNHVPAVGDG